MLEKRVGAVRISAEGGRDIGDGVKFSFKYDRIGGIEIYLVERVMRVA